jgi:hypothetical protein
MEKTLLELSTTHSFGDYVERARKNFGSQTDQQMHCKNSSASADSTSISTHNHFHIPDKYISTVINFWRDNCQPATPSARSSIRLDRSNDLTRVQKLEQRVPDQQMYDAYVKECAGNGLKPVSKTTFIYHR